MKHAIIGTLLILYCLFLTPAFVEPSDAVISTGWITVAMSFNIPMFIIGLWIASGYIALILGIGLLGHSFIRHFPAISVAKKPIVLISLALIIVLIVYWFYYGI